MTRLSTLPAGTRARVVMVTPELRNRVDRLISLGLAPGSEIELLRTRPAFVVAAAETQIALDEDVARKIYVQRLA